jgi:TRAP-type uncharacterized transport system substrate-binding protein
VAGLKKPVELFGIAYALYCYPWVSDDVVYAVVKAIGEGYDIFKGAHPWLKQWKVENMVKNPKPIPFHPGAIKYFKEAGVWTPALDRYQAEYLK